MLCTAESARIQRKLPIIIAATPVGDNWGICCNSQLHGPHTCQQHSKNVMSRIDSSIRLSIIPLNNDSSSALYALKKNSCPDFIPFIRQDDTYIPTYLPKPAMIFLWSIRPYIPTITRSIRKSPLIIINVLFSAQQGCGYYAPRRSGCTPITSVNWLSGQTSLPSLLPSVILWSEYIREVPLPPYPFRIHRWTTNPDGFFSLDSG